MNFFNKIKTRAKAITQRLENVQEAVAFAEAGHSAKRGAGTPSAPAASRKLLVVGRESMFSPAVVDYAIEMAQRMSYEIVALNTAPLSCDSFKFLSASQKKICQEFKTLSVDQAQKFRQEATEKGLKFTHVVKFSDHDRAIADLQRELSSVEFVISDSEPETVEKRITETDRPAARVCVYTMI